MLSPRVRRFLPLLLPCLAPACSPVEGDRKEAMAVDALPLTEYRDTTVLDMHDGSRLAWRLSTLRLVRWPGSQLVHATPVELVLFDSLGALELRVTADSGAVDEPGTFLLAAGNVYGRSRRGMELRTDSLRWSKELDQVTTEARVHVVSEQGDTLTGTGFVSDARLERWRILSGVRAVFPNAGERARGLDTPPGGIPPEGPEDSGATSASPAAPEES